MKPPRSLSGEARDYWKRHADRLAAAGLLTDADVDSFALLCQLWADVGRLRQLAEADPRKNRNYLDSVKAWQSMARQFALLPLERKKHGLERKESLQDFIARVINNTPDDTPTA